MKAYCFLVSIGYLHIFWEVSVQVFSFFSAAVIKYSVKSNLREKGLIVDHSLFKIRFRSLYIMVERQSREAAAHITNTVKHQRAMNVCMLFSSLSPFIVQDASQGRLPLTVGGLPTSIKAVKISPLEACSGAHLPGNSRFCLVDSCNHHKVLCPFLIWLFVFFWYWTGLVPYTLWIIILYQRHGLQLHPFILWVVSCLLSWLEAF